MKLPFRINPKKNEVEYRVKKVKVQEEDSNIVPLPFRIKLEETKTYKKPGDSLPFTINNYKLPLVDDWEMKPEDMLFQDTDDDCIVLPISTYYYGDKASINDPVNFFDLKAKRCYQGKSTRSLFIKYLNYFEKFYDTTHYLFVYYAQIKYCIDYYPTYDKQALFDDIFKYIFNPVMLNKIILMNEYNYRLHLGDEVKDNGTNISLQYINKHAKVLYQISLMQKMIIPLLCHFIKKRKLEGEVNEILMDCYIIIMDMFPSVDIIAKLSETVGSAVKRSINAHPLWNMQGIRGINPTTHSIESVKNIPLQLIPKYEYNRHIIAFNSASIRKNIGYKVLEIGYGFKFIGLSASSRDDDNNSKVDKYEARLEKTNESKHIYILENASQTLYALTHNLGLGKFTTEEVAYYKKELSRDNKSIINPFQQELIINFLAPYFGDPRSPLFTNVDEYILMMLVVKRILQQNMILLPYILSARVVRLVDRKSISKKWSDYITSSNSWKYIKEIYNNPAIEEKILGIIAKILCSEFAYIDYDNQEITGMKIDMMPEIVSEEVQQFIRIMNVTA